MNIEIKKIIRPLDLREYAAEMEIEIEVWVNPPRGMLIEYDGLVEAAKNLTTEHTDATEGKREEEKEEISVGIDPTEIARRLEEIGGAQMELIARLWSQGPEETRWTVEELRELVEKSMDTDPGLWRWLVRKTFRMISEHRAGQKKV